MCECSGVERMSDGWLKVAQEALKLPGLLVEIYGDLAKPGVKQAGKALETVIGLGNTVLWPIAWANERTRIALEKNLEKYRKEMESVSEDDVVGVAPEIGVPVAEKLAYVTDERLTNLYVKLLATASNQSGLENAHPSFVNVINNLSPDEALFLEYFVSNDSMPFVLARAVIPDKGSYNVISEPIVPQEALSGLTFPSNIEAYLCNLEGLGLLEVRDDKFLSDDSIYEPLKVRHREELMSVLAKTPRFVGRKLDFAKGTVKRTSFGKKFIAACHGQ